ncbi:MAG: 3-deoxy-7-phosphoheptulonate synthase [Sphingobacteriales bacterium 17-39-43]|jgi:chorismate mutase|uniref:chorismate mutase n=1 Tax=Daejeonella sp. TaxID=2805397 RepID=UPI000BCA8E07|nr:chorismate mutase [Daejeonella sp.]MCF8453614.1 chorismate mutase [Pedobacter sp.]OYY06144.1 MAG: 3-deoxy-7-phosphoheptulonate synthase [Sphingobacteriia bacterium 35-40-5]OYZ31977.1 MAG: 3-deoxy-7-phosphoheptulonate synthase [Sphingobacteriales bacterium 16-39-50]OYZ59300.1 MAG: 3-deoxy-7-phosphoheptulonate synthase [Sphingobacteriales bacterium 24-40-4]OZA25281.1 MAG: 3-deoxy-7-phosphoheptulonate synthase [Sphingobacteriales bacterium 17-39-43]
MKLNLKLQPLSTWVKTKNEPLLIAGPCSAETEDQLMATAHLLAKTGKVSVLRAGIWKPRTRPGEFEGIGSIGLTWLKRAKEETGLPTAVEVANAKHVEEALAAGVDILWVGARSTVNPFTVQEIADALKGVDIPVMVKNPVNPDLQLWVGALERFNNAGITKLAAIHRGFSSFEKTAFRNEPMWELAIQLKTLCPELPIINDPSHICGNRELIQYVAQKALDLDMQGLMIESHLDPSVAWTDAKQQLTPAALSELMELLTLRKPESKDKEFTDKLADLRTSIDKIDDQIIQKIAERMQVVQKIGEFKRDNGVTILQVNRWDQIMNKRSAFAKALKLDLNFTGKLLELIHSESIRKQTEIMNDKVNVE